MRILIQDQDSEVAEQKLVALSGSEALAYAFKQALPHVTAVFPITPQTEMMHKYTEFVANGESDTEMILIVQHGCQVRKTSAGSNVMWI